MIYYTIVKGSQDRRQEDVVALSRTTNPDHVIENPTVFDFELRRRNGRHPDAGKAQQPDRLSGWFGSGLGVRPDRKV